MHIQFIPQHKYGGQHCQKNVGVQFFGGPKKLGDNIFIFGVKKTYFILGVTKKWGSNFILWAPKNWGSKKIGGSILFFGVQYL